MAQDGSNTPSRTWTRLVNLGTIAGLLAICAFVLQATDSFYNRSQNEQDDIVQETVVALGEAQVDLLGEMLTLQPSSNSADSTRVVEIEKTVSAMADMIATLQGTPVFPEVTPEITSQLQISYRFQPISISPYANADILEILPDFPTGNQIFAGIPFDIPVTDNRLSTECANSLERPSKFTVPLGYIENADSIYVLVNAGYTSGYSDKQVGTITVYYTDGLSLSFSLILGQNIREWRIGAFEQDQSVVISAISPDHHEVYVGPSPSGGLGVQDLLKLTLTESFRNSMLDSMVIEDNSQELYDSGNPCLRIVGVTVRSEN